MRGFVPVVCLFVFFDDECEVACAVFDCSAVVLVDTHYASGDGSAEWGSGGGDGSSGEYGGWGCAVVDGCDEDGVHEFADFGSGGEFTFEDEVDC